MPRKKKEEDQTTEPEVKTEPDVKSDGDPNVEKVTGEVKDPNPPRQHLELDGVVLKTSKQLSDAAEKYKSQASGLNNRINDLTARYKEIVAKERACYDAYQNSIALNKQQRLEAKAERINSRLANRNRVAQEDADLKDRIKEEVQKAIKSG